MVFVFSEIPSSLNWEWGEETSFLGSCCPSLIAWRKQHQNGWVTSSIQKFIPKVILKPG